MKETTSAAMPPCFDKWCGKFDDLLRNKSQKREFRNYIGGLLGESERKNVSQIARDSVEVTYHRLHHFLTEAPWEAKQINERRLGVMNKCSQTKISRGFSLIVDDSGQSAKGARYANVKVAILPVVWDGSTSEKLAKQTMGLWWSQPIFMMGEKAYP